MAGLLQQCTFCAVPKVIVTLVLRRAISIKALTKYERPKMKREKDCIFVEHLFIFGRLYFVSELQLGWVCCGSKWRAEF